MITKDCPYSSTDTDDTGKLHSLHAREFYAIIQYMLLTGLHIQDIIASMRKVAT